MDIRVREPGRLVVDYRPTMRRILGWAVVGAGLILMFTNTARAILDFRFWAGLMLAVLGLVSQVFYGETTICLFQESDASLRITRIKHFLQNTVEEYALDQISRIHVEERKGSKKLFSAKGPGFRILIQLQDGKKVPLTNNFLPKPKEQIMMVAQNIQGFLAKKIDG